MKSASQSNLNWCFSCIIVYECVTIPVCIYPETCKFCDIARNDKVKDIFIVFRWGGSHILLRLYKCVATRAWHKWPCPFPAAGKLLWGVWTWMCNCFCSQGKCANEKSCLILRIFAVSFSFCRFIDAPSGSACPVSSMSNSRECNLLQTLLLKQYFASARSVTCCRNCWSDLGGNGQVSPQGLKNRHCGGGIH